MEHMPGRIGGEAAELRRRSAHEANVSSIEAGPPAPSQAYELHVCKGLNSCAHHDVTGTAPMAGMGECATVQHVCHGSNQCRGQGGCGYSGTDYQQSLPGDQACNNNGSCAVPINESRVFASGPFKGKSVWKRARKIFEARMYEAGVPFGPAPGEGYPDDLVPQYESPREGAPTSDGGAPPPSSRQLEA